MGPQLGRGVFPKICSNDIFMVKFVAHELLTEIKSEYLIILFPASPHPFLPSSLFAHLPCLALFLFQVQIFLHLFLKNKLSKSSSTGVKFQSEPWQNLSLIGLSMSAS